ncbi:MAG: hypothetical protein AAFR96_08230 [Planctomycetota bacterium]
MAGLLGGLVALAVWGKLRFVSDVPRMAYAEPEVEAGQAGESSEPLAGVHPQHEAARVDPD